MNKLMKKVVLVVSLLPLLYIGNAIAVDSSLIARENPRSGERGRYSEQNRFNDKGRFNEPKRYGDERFNNSGERRLYPLPYNQGGSTTVIVPGQQEAPSGQFDQYGQPY